MRVRFVLFAILLGQTTLLPQSVRVGAEILIERNLDLLHGKRVGILCNHTSTLANGTHLVDTLLSHNVTITALFSPEHGIRGERPAGVTIPDTIDEKTGLTIYSLYGVRRKPSSTMFHNIDVMIFDIQDVGARFFTYYITMAYAMEAAAEHNKTFVVLDRPNPINGRDIEGPLLDPSLQSGVGRFALPIRHGLTMGELARMIIGEKWLGNDLKLSLIVIPTENGGRDMWFDETLLTWIPPSPNMKYFSTAIVYPGTCLFEATNVSEGRGTVNPFEYIGAPWLDGDLLAQRLNALKLPGVRFDPVGFTPTADPIRAPDPKYNGKQCGGIFLEVTNRNTFKPVRVALKIIELLQILYPSHFMINSDRFDRLLGNVQFRTHLLEHSPVDSLLSLWNAQLDDFRQKRTKYLLY